MKKLAPVILTAALVGAFTLPHAQTTAVRVGYVETTELLKAHPKGQAALNIISAGNKELQPVTDEMKAIQAKGSSATAADRQKYDTLGKTLQARQQKIAGDYNKAVEPINNDVDAAVKAVAKAQGFGMVLDGGAARQSSLVVYADPSLDLTDEVVKQLKK